MTASGWKPTIQAAVAFDSDRFTVCCGELEYDDPMTAIISYDGRFPQPWSRVDVKREIVDVCYATVTDSAEPIALALSNEGDVYTLLEGRTERSKIPGAGVLSSDAEGLGAVHTLVLEGSTQFVIGNSRQIYRRNNGAAWERLSADSSRADGYEAEHFGKAISTGDGRLLIEGVQRPYSPPTAAQLDPTAWKSVSPEQFLRMMQQQRAQRTTRKRIQRLYMYSSGDLSQVSIPDDSDIRGLYLDPLKRVWLTGVSGLILRGHPDTGFERLGFHGDVETLFSAAWFDDALILATDDGLRRFDGHKLTVVKPTLNSPLTNRNVPVPLKIQVFDDTLMYFDAKHGVCRWDGETWQWFEIPPELLERNFGGLPARP
ncbi:hypothetical protein SJ05684_b57670 (plasmid) [Sinorhizobium sojae CCBAU 05684]|uniref:Uncharacterized protein n=1 Tax=Sinorhizobium sojae CCBAU 05684 TaxID=716928 RepID=A0A249PN75_9HYPH|nr:hypothetical protein [Sinorhizobium sojae]ASY66749.1 hypothetical protein SJ05684_b57670 [Sinorhizobium sojae CCBAU 05684]